MTTKRIKMKLTKVQILQLLRGTKDVTELLGMVDKIGNAKQDTDNLTGIKIPEVIDDSCIMCGKLTCECHY